MKWALCDFCSCGFTSAVSHSFGPSIVALYDKQCIYNSASMLVICIPFLFRDFILTATGRFMFVETQAHFSILLVVPSAPTGRICSCCCIGSRKLLAPSSWALYNLSTMTTSFGPVNQPRTILGPLTTTFTPPTSCENVCFSAINSYEMVGWRGQSCLHTFDNGMVSLRPFRH